MAKDCVFEEANHVTEFHVSEINKVGRFEPFLHHRRVFVTSFSTIEGRIRFSTKAIPEMGADKNEDIEK